MKKKILVAFLLVPVLFLGCKSPGGNGSDPKSVLSQFFESLSKKDIATARKLTTDDSQYMVDIIEEGMNTEQGSKAIDKYGKVKMEMGEVTIEADKATIPVTAADGGETRKYTLRKENGNWKVSFDKDALMEESFEEMMKKGIAPGDSIKKMMQQLKVMNMDSLNDELQKELKLNDSIK